MFKNTKPSRNLAKMLLVAVLFSLVSCKERAVEPIEKYGGSRYVVTNLRVISWGRLADLQLKNKDTIFEIRVLIFDVKNIKIGDTIR